MFRAKELHVPRLYAPAHAGLNRREVHLHLLCEKPVAVPPQRVQFSLDHRSPFRVLDEEALELLSKRVSLAFEDQLLRFTGGCDGPVELSDTGTKFVHAFGHVHSIERPGRSWVRTRRSEPWATTHVYPTGNPGFGVWGGTIRAMRPVLTPAASAALDAASPDPGPVLMERAGLGVALAAVGLGSHYGSRVIVLAGPGNNGGDGYVAARYLRQRGVAVQVRALGEPKSHDAIWAKATADAAGVPVRPLGPPEPADLIIDALFGSGFHGTLPDETVPWTEVPAPVLAVDIPSGLSGETGSAEGPVFRAAATVTFHSPKVGQVVGIGPDVCGTIIVRDIGLSGGDAAFLLVDEADAPRPPRPRTAHKWSAGSVMIVGGSPGMTGAPLLAARSALHGGAGSVSIAVPGGLQPIYAAAAPELLTAGIGGADRFEPEDARAVAEAAGRFDVVALGPGLGSGQDEFVAAFLEAWDGPLLVDADGLNALAGPEQLAAREASTVVTPHAGEFRRLTGVDATFEQAADLAAETGAVVLLKGSPTFVMGSERWAVVSGGPELATIGTGDVLTGLLGALWARGLDAETAARSAAYWHGRAGASLAGTRTVTADVLAREIGRFAW